MKDNLLNEEINRVKELMKLPINENKAETLKSITALSTKALKATDALVKNGAKNLKAYLKANPNNVKGALERVKNLELDANSAVKSAQKKLNDLKKQTNPPASATNIQAATDDLVAKKSDLDIIKREHNSILRTYGLKGASVSTKLTSALNRLTSSNVYPFIKKAVLGVGGGVAIYGTVALVNKIRKLIGDDICIENPKNKSKFNKVIAQSETGPLNYYLTNIENETLKSLYPKGIILQFDNANRKVFEINGKTKIATWYADRNCDIYIQRGGQKFKLFGAEEQQPVPTPDQGGGRRGGNYIPCTGTYSLLCFSQKIKELQKCVGTKPDGYWGKNTERAVVAKFGKNTLTDVEINQKCKAQPVAPSPSPAQPQKPNVDVITRDEFGSTQGSKAGSDADMF